MQVASAELTLQKRDDLVLYKELDRTNRHCYRWRRTAPACSRRTPGSLSTLAHNIAFPPGLHRDGGSLPRQAP